MIVKELIRDDLYRYTGGKKVTFLDKNRLYGYKYLKIWRLANNYRSNKLLFLVFGYLLYRKSLKYGFQISPHATIGRGLYLGHFGTVVIGNEVKIGSNVNIGVDVVIGKTNRGAKKGSPHISNNVWIGSGAKIVGGITIGENVLIAPNAYVNIDVPSNSIVLGNPAIIKSNENAVKDYIENIVDKG